MKQLNEHSIPSVYDYGGVSAPWIQIKLLKILALLGHDNKRFQHFSASYNLRGSEHMFTVLQETLNSVAEIKSNIAAGGTPITPFTL